MSPSTRVLTRLRPLVRAPGKLGMATILIVDDLAAHREFLVALLGEQGHRVLQAADGSEALAAVRSDHPDLVITDVLMPVMDGFEFVRRLRLDPVTSRIPVLFYTAPYGEREARALALASGVPYVLTKPARPEDVLKIVGRVLSRESEPRIPPDDAPLTTNYNREHLPLLTDKPWEHAGGLKTSNARLRALVNIGLELGSMRDTDRLLQSVCSAAHDLFGATYVTLGIVDPADRTVRRTVTCGAEAADWIMAGDPAPGILGSVVAERRPFRGDNPNGDPAGLRLPVLHPDVRAYLVAPIGSPAHVYGWICLVGNEGRSFTEDDEHLLMALSGQVGRMYEVEHEILEREQAESALRHERDRSQRYLDTAEVILLALDSEARITQVNRYACSLLGWTADELLGRDWIETCLPARIREAYRKQFHDLLDGDSSIIESPILTRSGEEREFEWRNTPLRDDAGHVIGTFSSGTDISRWNQAVEALRVAEERTRYALEAAGVGIWDLDQATGVLQWSGILESQYGLQPGTFDGTLEAFVERVHPEDRESVRETIAKAVKSGGDFSILNRALWPDGTVHWLSGAGRFRLGAHGDPVRGVGISLDVTERHTLEGQYQQAQKMEAIGRLAGGVAHDFNNLLTAILGYCELLLADFTPDDPRQADITEIQKAALSAAGLTRQLLAFSRKQIIEPTLLDLNEVVAGMREMLGRLIGEDVKVVPVLQPDLGPVKADRGQVEQVVMNLALNARDAMPKGGTLTIETADVELDEKDPNTHPTVKPCPCVALTVSDTGIGMTAEVQAHLFEPFFTTKEPGKGTGLGLATVQSIAARSGGGVTVSSEVGRGATFTVYFPRADPAETVAAPPLPAVPSRAGARTVLVVEDAEGLRVLAKRLLERQGYTVLLAANAGEAIRQFERNASIDVLLTDVVMPGASGPELTRRLLARQPALKVIYMSGYTEEAIVQHGVLKPGIAFLHKPFTSESLRRKIGDVLDGEALPLDSGAPTFGKPASPSTPVRGIER